MITLYDLPLLYPPLGQQILAKMHYKRDPALSIFNSV